MLPRACAGPGERALRAERVTPTDDQKPGRRDRNGEETVVSDPPADDPNATKAVGGRRLLVVTISKTC